jgi:hypothetical protein
MNYFAVLCVLCAFAVNAFRAELIAFDKNLKRRADI